MMLFILYVLFALYSIPCESLKCYECTGHVPCGQGQVDLMVDCSGICMVYLNSFDSDLVVRRCCTSDCGSPGNLEEYEGRTTYFCSSDECNGFGSEALLTGGTAPSSTITTAITTTSTAAQSALQCYDCSGPNCGKEGSNVISNCPTCMLYRNPDEQTTIERRCCWSGCGKSFSVGMYNGLQTYFCSYDKCNKYGAETILSPPVTGTVRTTTTTTSSTITTTPTSSCTLNCQNGGTLESENGCFCYCVDKTNGLECENIDCAQPDDDDPDTCIPENQSLCLQSDIFAYKCLYLCGKC